MYGTDDPLAQPDLYAALAQIQSSRARITSMLGREHSIVDYLAEVTKRLASESILADRSLPEIADVIKSTSVIA